MEGGSGGGRGERGVAKWGTSVTELTIKNKFKSLCSFILFEIILEC